MYYELSKREKKIARACIDKGIEAEFREGVEKSEAVIRDWKEGKFSNNREAYHQLFKVIAKKDKEIRTRYDYLTGSSWLETVAAILFGGYISDADIQEFSDAAKLRIENLIRGWKAYNE